MERDATVSFMFYSISLKRVYLNGSKLPSLFYIWKNSGQEKLIILLIKLSIQLSLRSLKCWLANTKRSWNKN